MPYTRPVYQPPHFREDRRDAQHALIRSHPLGTLVTAGPGGLIANPVPFVLYPDEAPLGTLRCHLAKANPQWRELEAVDACLVVFQGPQAYVTPTWYAAKRETGKVVPTWNYATVHAWGTPTVTHESAWIRRQIDDLTDAHEGRLPKPWRVDDAPGTFIEAQMKGIVGIEIVLTRIEGKWKMSQNRSAEDRAAVAGGLQAMGGEPAEVGAWVARLMAEPDGNR